MQHSPSQEKVDLFCKKLCCVFIDKAKKAGACRESKNT